MPGTRQPDPSIRHSKPESPNRLKFWLDVQVPLDKDRSETLQKSLEAVLLSIRIKRTFSLTPFQCLPRAIRMKRTFSIRIERTFPICMKLTFPLTCFAASAGPAGQGPLRDAPEEPRGRA